MTARIGERTVVLSLSGGKDSAAAGLYLREQCIPFVPVFNDTGWEHPSLYEHLDYLAGIFGPITVLRSQIQIPEAYRTEVEAIESRLGRESPMVRWCVHKAMFPSRMRRWCTQELKARPFIQWARAHPDELVNVLGIRHDESAARAKWPEWAQHPEVPSVEVWAPIIAWRVQDVVDIHARHGVTPCRLYLEGARRVGCWPCIQSNREELRLLSRDDVRVAILRDVESLVSKIRNEPRAWFQANVPMQDGTSPPWPIDRALEWAAETPRGRGQMDLFAALPSEAGCARWGMCDIYSPKNGESR
jgi:3'-phosphoadenosine 5'-phosphosulfate sulfotransferase (PAPS reductase)/FAD synthetase